MSELDLFIDWLYLRGYYFSCYGKFIKRQRIIDEYRTFREEIKKLENI